MNRLSAGTTGVTANTQNWSNKERGSGGEIGTDFQKLGILEELLDGYFPIMYEAPLASTPDKFTKTLTKVYGENRVFWHAKRRKLPDALTGIQAGYKLKTLDIAEIYGQYLKNANKSYNVRLLIRDLTQKFCEGNSS